VNQVNTIIYSNNQQQLSSAESAVIQCLLYFDTFTYPLTADEIFSFCSSKMLKKVDLEDTLARLKDKKLIKQKDIFYLINENEELVDRRIKGNNLALKVMPKALKYGRFISQFPFVDTVCISGSLSKNYFDEKGDVDFFIITKPHRLWLCRSLLVGFKKVFLLNSRKYFCVNYFVGRDSLQIPDRNIFTATEITSLIPVYNAQGYSSFVAANTWVYEHLPNFNPQNKIDKLKAKEGIIKKITEKILGGSIGELADKYLFNLTLNRWQKKFNHFNKTDFDLNMRSRKNVSKHHPSGFQQKVLQSWASNKVNFCKKHQVAFSDL
jgi:hypothetical protein